MKRLLALLFAAAVAAPGLSSCSDDTITPPYYDTPPVVLTGLDKWLHDNYLVPYNIEVVYIPNPLTLDPKYGAVAARLESSRIMAVLLKHLWLDTYVEAAGEDNPFIQQYAPRRIIFAGFEQLLPNDDAKRIIIYELNRLSLNTSATPGQSAILYDKSDEYLTARILAKYFRPINSEFVQLLLLSKSYGNGWTQITDYPAAPKQDFGETFASYICLSEDEWDALVASADEDGREKIAAKAAFVKAYMKTNWNLDMDDLRTIIHRRASQIDQLDYVDLE
jgi:hypothetical protein